MSERYLIDLIGNMDIELLRDRIIEHDMKGFSGGKRVAAQKFILFLIPAVLIVFIVLFVGLIRKEKH